MIIKKLSQELNISEKQIENAVKLIDEGNTIPFISRYRKEATGGLDDQVLRHLNDRLNYLRNLDTRKQEVISSIEGQGKLTDEIVSALEKADTLAEVEDIYRPYKQKRKTRATAAIEKGLLPLAELILEGNCKNVTAKAEEFIDEEKGVTTSEEAIAGASDIIAEKISDDAEVRKKLYDICLKEAVISTLATDSEADTPYKNYYKYSEGAKKLLPHRILAIDRGEREKALKVTVDVDNDKVLSVIRRMYINKNNSCADIINTAIEDSFKRLIHPSLERRLRTELTEKACESSIEVFSDNLRQLLMQPPVKNAVTLGLDPAYRTGCKIAVVDDTGKVLDTTVIYPTPPHNKIEEAKAKLKVLIKKHKVTVIAIGNGTASHESEVFVAGLIKKLDTKVSYMVVSESGASVYSASELAAKEFPDYDVSLRSAVSIARRLQDPLAELVKIDPKAIGVGQYQHDMPPARLSDALGGVVEDCVNSVGVDLNTASPSLLNYVAGINTAVAGNIVAYREENGSFKKRNELLKVPKLGKKAYEQCAGFMRIHDGVNPLDNTAVHPESYKAAEELLKKCGYTMVEVAGGIPGIIKAVENYGKSKLASELDIGIPTLTDIVNELAKPGRDPRDELPAAMLREDIVDATSLKPGMVLDGTVRNITDFGAFIDIGVHQDGLVHISQLADRYVKHPLDVVKVGQIVKVKVLEVDKSGKRISLSMKGI